MAITLDGGNMVITPTRDDLLLMLENLCSGKTNRADVAAWAFSIIEDDTIRVTDGAVRDVLKGLGAVDIPASDRDFLYTEDGFTEWAARLRGE